VAAACLRHLAAAAEHEDLRREAEQLRARWHLDDKECAMSGALPAAP